MRADSLSVLLGDLRALIDDVEPEVGDAVYHRARASLAVLERLVTEMEHTRVCVQCERPWTMSERDLAWFATRGMHLPARCKTCRLANRKVREARVVDLAISRGRRA